VHWNEVTEGVIGAAINVHRELGPGLLESAYQACLAHELNARGLSVEREVPLPVIYKGLKMDCGYRLDLIVQERVIVEVKCVERFDPIHVAQVVTYLKLSGRDLALLINFNVPLLKHGIKRIVHGLPEPSRPQRLGRETPSPGRTDQ
jgi:GxxExxY protein